MFDRKQDKPQKRIDCLIGAGTTVDGNVSFTGGLRVDGVVRGNVSTANGETGTLVVSEQARIDGEIKVSHVVVNGTVNGPIAANEFLELQAKAGSSAIFRTARWRCIWVRWCKDDSIMPNQAPQAWSN